MTYKELKHLAETLSREELYARMKAIPLDDLLDLLLEAGEDLHRIIDEIPEAIERGMEAKLSTDKSSLLETQKLMKSLMAGQG